MSEEYIELSLRNLIGGGYDDVVNAFDDPIIRYIAIKGSRNSKKSYTVAYLLILGMIEHPDANVLVVRKIADNLRDSCFSMLKKLIHSMGMQRYWRFSKSPIEIEYRPTGQKILFRGLDDPLKLSSLQVEKGYLCWAWFEEAYQIGLEKDFDLVDQSIRGMMPPGLYKKVFLTFNPWNKAHWLRTRFFETEDGHKLTSPDTFATTTNYLINEWIDDADLRFFNRMKELNPRLYESAGLGNWGNPEGLIYEKWEEREFDINEIRQIPNAQAIFGLDFGYTTDPSALFCGIVDRANYTVYVFDELYEKGLTSKALARRIKEKGYRKEHIVCDSEAPMQIAELAEEGLTNLSHSFKFPGSVKNGISRIQDYKIVVHPRCVNFLTEIANYMWKIDKKLGIAINEPEQAGLNHLMDAMRYAFEGLTIDGFGGFGGSTELEERYPYPLESEREPNDDKDIDNDESWCFSI